MCVPTALKTGSRTENMIAAVTRPTKSKREGSRIFLNPVSFLFVSSVIRRALRSRKRGSRPLSIPTWIMRARAVSPRIFPCSGQNRRPSLYPFYFQQFFFYGAVIRYVRYIGKGVGQGFPAFQKCRQGKRHTDEVQPPDKREAEKKRICTSFSPFTS